MGTVPPTETNCGTGKAVIEIYDANWIRACGCNEADNTLFSSGQNLTCTVNVGTVLFLHHIGIAATHQLTFDTYGTAPLFAPKSGAPVQTYGFPLNQTGSFQFYDIFFPSFTGTITVL